MQRFKFLKENTNPYDREINPNYYRRLTITFPPAGLSHYQWNILPQDLKEQAETGNHHDMLIYLDGWQSSRCNIVVNPYSNPHTASVWDRGFTDHQIRVANPPRIRECAVISASLRDFNNWKREIFDIANVQMITSGEFIHTNGNNNVTTRYRAILSSRDCFGQMFNDYVLTPRTNEILERDFHDDYIMNHINDIINEVSRHTIQVINR